MLTLKIGGGEGQFIMLCPEIEARSMGETKQSAFESLIECVKMRARWLLSQNPSHEAAKEVVDNWDSVENLFTKESMVQLKA